MSGLCDPGFAVLTSKSDLDGIEGALKECTETSAIKRVLLRKDMLQRVKKYDAKLLNILQNFQVCPGSAFHLLLVVLIFDTFS
jgi:hypothetical protein